MSKHTQPLAVRPLVFALAIALLAGCASKTSEQAQDASSDKQTNGAKAVSAAQVENRDAAAASGMIASAPHPAIDSRRESKELPAKSQASEHDALKREPVAQGIAESESRGQRQPQPMSIAATPITALSKELPVNTENYLHSVSNPIKLTASDPVSTFSIDVDTGSYTNSRRMLTQENRLPPRDAVRSEEFINYFDYGYPQPEHRAQPFSVTTELGAAPWNTARELLLIGLKGYEMQKSEIPAANLVFLLDVSGSMNEPNKLPLLKASIAQMVERMSARDRVSIVVYAGAAGVVLEPTPGDQRERILSALEALQAGGSTNGGAGIELAYKLAAASKIESGVNRILLATDGDFNVGEFDPNALTEYVASKRKTGISLSTLGFGADNYNDALAEQLADVGNGKYAYIDSLAEASKVLGREIAGSLYTIAGDVKIQIEFNPSVVSEYRLIGYENRQLAREDFNNDQVDAGDIGAGHTVTALYEISRVGSASANIDSLRYASNAKSAKPVKAGPELAFLKLRYKLPNQSRSVLISEAISSVPQSSPRLGYVAMVAAFAEHLRGGKYANGFGLAQIERELSALKQPTDSELSTLVASARQIEGPAPAQISAAQ